MVEGSGNRNRSRHWNRSKVKETGIGTLRLYQNVILIHMIHEEKKDFPSDILFDLWRKRQHFTIPKLWGQPFMSLPKTFSQLLYVIQNSGYPGVSKATVEECLSELVDLGVLMKFARTGTDRQFNRVFYALPWAIKYDDHYQHQYRHYYIPWKLSVPKETLDALINLPFPLPPRIK
jgi:hypothetical protein